MEYKVIGLFTEKVYISGKTKAECNRFMQRMYPSLEAWENASYTWAGIDHMAYKQKEKIYDEPIAVVPVNVDPNYINSLMYIVNHHRVIGLARTGWSRRKNRGA